MTSKWSRRDSNPRPSRAHDEGALRLSSRLPGAPRGCTLAELVLRPQAKLGVRRKPDQWKGCGETGRFPRVKMETAGVEPTSCSLQARGPFRGTSPRDEVRTGGVEPPQPEAAGLQPAELARAQRPRRGVTDRIRTGTDEVHGLGCCVTPRPPRERGRPDSNPHRPRCKRGARPIERRPQGRVRTGGVEPPQPEAARLQRAELTSAQHPQE